MSGFSAIYFRYKIEDRDPIRGKGKIYKGFIGRAYKGFMPYHIFVRGTVSVEAAISSLLSIRYISDEEIRRTIDVDFVARQVDIGISLEDDVEPKEKFEKRLKENFDEALEENMSSIFFVDCNYYGGFFVDIDGYIGDRNAFEENKPTFDFKIKYCFVDNVDDPELIMDVHDYVEHFKEYFTEDNINPRLVKEVNEILNTWDDDDPNLEPQDSILSLEELEDYKITTILDYIYGDDDDDFNFIN